MSEHRCGGACCECFTLPLSPSALATEAAKAKRGLSTWGAEIAQVAEMVVLIGEFAENPAFHDGVAPDDAEMAWWYTCSNLTHGGECRIYAERPPMCRDYPRYSDGDRPKARCSYANCADPTASETLLPVGRLRQSARALRVAAR